jgi:acyl-CoA hydrolase
VALRASLAPDPGEGHFLADVKMLHLHCEGPGPHLAPSMALHFRHRAFFIGKNARDAVGEGRAEYIPVFLSDIPRLFARGILRLDAALVNLSPPDPHGYCSLGTSVDIALQAVRNARTVIAQLNRSMPRTLGDGFVHVDDVDLAVEVDVPPYQHLAPAPGEVERRIGEFVASLVPDGATLQMGIGDDNPAVEMRPSDYTNDSALIRRFRHMVAINSALEVDMTGQVCADSIGTRLYSGVGGQMDFVRGATLADEGRAIIALPSTAMGGMRSRIVATLSAGAGVVTTRAHVDVVVTEHGVARLHGRSIPERVRELAAIAAPEFRGELLRRARDARFV